MSQRRANQGTSADDKESQQPTADYWNNAPAPQWMGPLAYYNQDMGGQFQTGLSFTGGPGFSGQPSQPRSSPMEDTLFEINQTGLSPMWREVSPAYIDPRVGRPIMQARPPLPFQYVSEPPSDTMPTNTRPGTWGVSPGSSQARGRGQASSRQPGPFQSLMAQSAPGEALGTVSPAAVSQSFPQQQYAPYPPYPGPLASQMTPMPGSNPYENTQQAQPPVQETGSGPMLVQLGASHNFLVDNRPARWIQVLDVDPSYQSARTPSPQRAPALNIYVRAPETEVHYWAVFLRDLTVQELIKRVVQKYGFSDDERDRVTMAVRVEENTGEVQRLTDEDVKNLESEIAIDVKVTTMEIDSEDWQLELRF